MELHTACLSIQRDMESREERLTKQRDQIRVEMGALAAEPERLMEDDGRLDALKADADALKAKLAGEFQREHASWNAAQRDQLEHLEEV
jgi:hypothetical protein